MFLFSSNFPRTFAAYFRPSTDIRPIGRRQPSIRYSIPGIPEFKKERRRYRPWATSADSLRPERFWFYSYCSSSFPARFFGNHRENGKSRGSHSLPRHLSIRSPRAIAAAPSRSAPSPHRAATEGPASGAPSSTASNKRHVCRPLRTCA